MKRILTTAALALALPLGIAPAAQASTHQAQLVAQASTPKARNLKVTPAVRKALGDAYWNRSTHFKRSQVDGPTHVYYGELNHVYWALGQVGVKGDEISYQDGPHIWKRKAKGRWVHVGDTGGDLSAVPKALLKVWHLTSPGG
ncbi:hypothetical protein ACIBG8_03875 [Nonomuraea sp. NPDC050556]|uniref:hypothetical protein n=1 Tax=Nonomuraea sp. NPDC050556 TaxID=3364369 RepID=UPI0037890D01